MRREWIGALLAPCNLGAILPDHMLWLLTTRVDQASKAGPGPCK
ncbi:hypothetical protein ACVMHY_003070 [Bradyrhizobium barranii subsp. barranii]|nr:hypothetical protein [Bradyrhizobium japonicum]